MPAISKVTNDIGGLLVPGGPEPVYRDELLTLAGADDLLANTILARDTATLKLVLYVKGGSTNGNGVPDVVLPYPVSVTGAGDVRVRVLIGGRVRKERLVIDADASDTNIDGAVVDQLRARGITPESTKQLATLDP